MTEDRCGSGTLVAGAPVDNLRKFQAHPQSVPGDFYVVNQECISCGAPHVVAPDLIGWGEGSESQHCIWKKQPETAEELEQAFAAFDASEVGCYRYAGNDPAIMKRIGLDYCDHFVVRAGQIERHFVDDDSPVEIQFSLTASKETAMGSMLKRAIAGLASTFGRKTK